MKRVFPLTISMLLLLSCVKEPETVTFWTYYPVPYIEAAEELIERFHSLQDEVRVELVSYPFNHRYQEKVNDSLASGEGGDLILYYGSVLPLQKQGFLMPVPDELQEELQLDKRLYEAALENRYVRGSLYGIPMELNVESPGLLVNREILAREGLAIPEEWYDNYGPPSYSELISLARDLTVEEDGKIVRSGLGVVNRQESSLFLSLIWQLGGEYRFPGENQIRFETDEAARALEIIKGLIDGKERVHEYKSESALEQFINGELPMIMGAPWYCADLPDSFPYEYFNLPSFVENSPPYFLSEGGWGLIVNRETPYPESVWTFVKFLMENENLISWSGTVGSVPPVKNLNPADFSGEGNEKWLLPTLAVLPYGRDPGAFTGDTFSLVWSIVRQNLRSYLLDEQTREETLRKMEEESRELLISQ